MNPEELDDLLERVGRAANNGSPELREKLRVLLRDRRIPLVSRVDIGTPLKNLGRGTFAQVELIHYQNRLYAHKKPANNSFIQRMSIIEEGLKLSEFTETHRNIQKLYYVTRLQNYSFGILIDYCSSGSLDRIVEDRSIEYTLVDVINWAHQLADALMFLHAKHLVHRDVKIQNILLKDDRKTLVLTDYGTAANTQRALMTNGAGTPITMAPEVFLTKNYSEKCDIFSWSIVFWQLITRKLYPYDVQNFTFLFAVAQDKLRPDKIKGCPPLISALLYRSWHSNPNERPSFSFIKTVLKLLLKQLPQQRQEYRPDILDNLTNQWVNECGLPREYLPIAPRDENLQSMYIYQDHLQILRRIIPLYKQKEKLERYDRLLDENETLTTRLQELRSQSTNLSTNSASN